MIKKLIYISLVLQSFSCFSEDIRLRKENIEKLIKDYILNNPSIIIESLEKYKEKTELEMRNQLEGNINSFYSDEAYKNFPYIGKDDAEVIITEFIDYNCGYCKKTINTVDKMYKNIKNIKIVFIDFPILSESSEMAAKAALASHKQNSYFQFHRELLKQRGPITQEILFKIAENLRLDIPKFKKDMQSSVIKEQIEKNILLAQDLNIRGTPTFIIGKTILPGAYDYEKLEDIIKLEKKEL